MDYTAKYLKYKKKYLNLSREINRGYEPSENIITIKNLISIEKIMELFYKKFWDDIYYNDAYVYYYNAIAFLKNTQNNKFHSFFSNNINRKLYEGSCPYVDMNDRKDWIHGSDQENIVNLDDLCRVSVQTINLLDQIFEICPRIPEDVVLYRFENRPVGKIPDFKVGDLYRSLSPLCYQ
ncbi:MAG: hypothetical protein Harvfovirus60_5 [Harvfovirus sp.]|uniref:Uncharacterized protein n=1 Tax=Harvfovirus sp. TaxID=2487768 RepID=A0A3G5A3J3_9VIRU|nr:MAG: hypothetical protein Harvfovirus60_5 [Harvfovirus sp.]